MHHTVPQHAAQYPPAGSVDDLRAYRAGLKVQLSQGHDYIQRMHAFLEKGESMLTQLDAIIARGSINSSSTPAAVVPSSRAPAAQNDSVPVPARDEEKQALDAWNAKLAQVAVTSAIPISLRGQKPANGIGSS